MPLLFAVTLFVSASLLFMVQPMVGKLVLPLLGGSPAVWNACMVFFQALLLLGYLYADRLTRVKDTRKQWLVHMGVLALPVVVFVLAAVFGSRHLPIAVAESLAPSDGSSAIISVLLILTVAIGIPFFVVSTSATLLQKWFTYTGHPSARDPYFLYAASNFGSLISLLGYPIFIEPNMTQGGQTWFWAAGFVALVGFIAFCGRAAVNPLGVPPASGKQGGKQQPANAASVPVEAPPTWARMAKWTVLAFVPSSLMLGVTFHMTTDIASIPLLWVGPLALYLITFIIAFSHLPPWFRILIGNLAPVMILLLIFLMISDVKPGTGLELLLYNMTFFAAALMCHYELARDRPSPQYLTQYFLIMSFGGVCGGIFNSLIAPLVFTHAYEFPLALIVACLMVPMLNPLDNDEEESKMSGNTALAADVATGVTAMNPVAYAGRWVMRLVDRNKELAKVLDIVIPVMLGLAFWQLQKMPQHFEWYAKMLRNIASAMPWKMAPNTVYVVITFALPVMVCFFFVDRPLRFALSVAAILIPVKINSDSANTLHTERSFFGILKIEEQGSRQFLMDRTRYYELTDGAVVTMRGAKVPESVIQKLMGLKDKELPRHDFQRELAKLLTYEEYTQYEMSILDATRSRENSGEDPVRDADGKPIVMGHYKYHRLVHGTTLHGTQVAEHNRHILDDFQLLTAGNVWDNIAVAGVQTAFDARQEPLTYYHRTGPVGAMFAELTRRDKDKQHVAMVGLGTGSVSCYARPGQKLTYYEIDPAVIRLVAETDKYFSYVKDAERRGAIIDFRKGDARLKLKQTDDKYALLMIDAFSSDSIPVHLLTNEAVGLYLDRLTDDGILALHISNKFVKLEPVVAAIAEHHGLVARVWNDDAERQHGKTASSWVVLARKREHLGEQLCSPIGDYIGEFHGGVQLMDLIINKYPAARPVADLPFQLQPGGKPKEPATKKPPRESVQEWLDARKGDPQADLFAAWLRKADSEHDTLMRILVRETGYGFRPVETLKGVDPWTDDYADVMRVMMISELQSIRKFFGLPTPVEK